MSTSYDPYRQRQREAVRQAPVTVRNAPGGPASQPSTPAPEPETAPAPSVAPSRADQLRALDRDDLVELAGRHGLTTWRVKSTQLVAQLDDMGVGPDTGPGEGQALTGNVGPQ